MTERWRVIPGWEGLYEISDMGTVRSLDHHGRRQFHRGRVLKPRPSGQGQYPAVGLHRDGEKVDRYVHHLVLLTFVGPRPEGMHTRHLNGDQTDNRLINLAYGTPVENAADKVGHGTARTRATVATHCMSGRHEYTLENTIWTSRGQRSCRQCRREWDREYKKKRRVARKAARSEMAA